MMVVTYGSATPVMRMAIRVLQLLLGQPRVADVAGDSIGEIALRYAMTCLCFGGLAFRTGCPVPRESIELVSHRGHPLGPLRAGDD
jgi:hypothetical protein